MPCAPARLLTLLIAAAAVLAPVRASEEDQIERPEAARRIVHVFDFEERPLNQEPVPMHWFRAQDAPPERTRPGFPVWNQGAFDTSFSVSGEHSVRLPTQGGSASLRLSSGVLPAIPGADYLITSRVRTAGLAHARARLSARLLDEHRRIIPGSERHGPLLVSEGEWTRTSVRISAVDPESAWIQLDLELLQPAQQEDAIDRGVDWEILRAQRVLLEDVSGAAWFDDVIVAQAPRLRIGTRSPANVVVAPTKPTLSLQVTDLTGESLTAVTTVYDIDGAQVERAERRLDPGGGAWEWAPTVESFGWRRARLEAVSDGQVIAHAEADFAWLPDDDSPDPEPFLLIAEGLTPERLQNLPDIAASVGVGAVQVSGWNDDLVPESARAFAEALEIVVRRLADERIGVDFALGRPPRALLQEIGLHDESPLAALGAAPGRSTTGEPQEPAWSPFLGRSLSKFGQRVRRWQIGATGDDSAFWRADLAAELAVVERALSRLVPKPIVALPWSVEQSIDSRVGDSRALTVLLPWTAPAESIAPYAEYWADRVDVTLVLQPPPPEAAPGVEGVSELVRRAVGAWAAGIDRLAIERPWRAETVGGTQESPTPALAVWRQVTARLGGRRVVGELPVADGAKCYILDGPAGGALVGWTEWASPEDAMVNTLLSTGQVTAVDIWGNRGPLPVEDGLHRLALGPTPIFVEGIDVPLALFRAGFKVTPTFLPAEATLHTMELIVRNPWPIAISGALRVVEPEGWKIDPRARAFDLPAGGEARLVSDVAFGVGEEAGVKRVVAEVDLFADRRYSGVRIESTIELGLREIMLTPSFVFLPDAGGGMTDIGVTLTITNTGREPVSLQSFALAPGFPREQAPVSDLEPGQSAVRRFIFRSGADTLMGRPIRVGLIEVNGNGRLNKSVMIE